MLLVKNSNSLHWSFSRHAMLKQCVYCNKHAKVSQNSDKTNELESIIVIISMMSLWEGYGQWTYIGMVSVYKFYHIAKIYPITVFANTQQQREHIGGSLNVLNAFLEYCLNIPGKNLQMLLKYHLNIVWILLKYSRKEPTKITKISPQYCLNIA